jgi:hypothetical protein
VLTGMHKELAVADRWRAPSSRRLQDGRLVRRARRCGLDVGGAAGVSMRPAAHLLSMGRDGLLPQWAARLDNHARPGGDDDHH